MIGLLGSDGSPLGGMRRGRLTGVDGMVTLDGVKEGSYSLIALTSDLAPLVQPGILVTAERDGTAELRLTEGGSLWVKVVDADGQAVAGASVSLVEPTGIDLEPLLPTIRMLEGLPTATGSDGTITFPRLSPGKYRVTVRTDSGQTVEGSAELSEGKAASITLKMK
jgi:hypothetical protein